MQAVHHSGWMVRLHWEFGPVFSLQVGEYSFDRHNGRILVIYTAVDGEYRLTFSLKHGELRGCSEPYPANESKALEVK